MKPLIKILRMIGIYSEEIEESYKKESRKEFNVWQYSKALNRKIWQVEDYVFAASYSCVVPFRRK